MVLVERMSENPSQSERIIDCRARVASGNSIAEMRRGHLHQAVRDQSSSAPTGGIWQGGQKAAKVAHLVIVNAMSGTSINSKVNLATEFAKDLGRPVYTLDRDVRVILVATKEDRRAREVAGIVEGLVVWNLASGQLAIADEATGKADHAGQAPGEPGRVFERQAGPLREAKQDRPAGGDTLGVERFERPADSPETGGNSGLVCRERSQE